jgi:hypothetical protein
MPVRGSCHNITREQAYSGNEIATKPEISNGRYYRKSIEIIDTYKSIDTFDTRKNIGNSIPLEPACFWSVFLTNRLILHEGNRLKAKNVDMMLFLNKNM